MAHQQVLLQGLSAAMDVGLHLAQGYTQQLSDGLVADVFEVEEHEGHALMIGKPAQRLLQLIAFVGLL